ncbi:FAD-dependent oxidoreductase [Streptomyces collinus]|uniref:FAD-dependent oxidoreductase n=1 Tax=Streptomyces collinus TaxID=42684 RepID=UPI003426D59E
MGRRLDGPDDLVGLIRGPRVGGRPFPPDGLPVIDRVPGHANAFAATGHGMLGVTLGPVPGSPSASSPGAGPRRSCRSASSGSGAEPDAVWWAMDLSMYGHSDPSLTRHAPAEDRHAYALVTDAGRVGGVDGARRHRDRHDRRRTGTTRGTGRRAHRGTGQGRR